MRHSSARYSWTKLDRHGALADRAGDALDRSMAHVAGGEDARQARLEQERVAVEVPAQLRRPDVGPGQDEAAVVAGDHPLQPRGARLLADEHEDGAHGQVEVPVGRRRTRRARGGRYRAALELGTACGTSTFSSASICSTRYALMPARRPSPRTSRWTRGAKRDRWTAAWPAELPPPMTPTSASR